MQLKTFHANVLDAVTNCSSFSVQRGKMCSVKTNYYYYYYYRINDEFGWNSAKLNNNWIKWILRSIWILEFGHFGCFGCAVCLQIPGVSIFSAQAAVCWILGGALFEFFLLENLTFAYLVAIANCKQIFVRVNRQTGWTTCDKKKSDNR